MKTFVDPSTLSLLTAEEQEILTSQFEGQSNPEISTLQEYWNVAVGLAQNWSRIGSWAPVATIIATITSFITAVAKLEIPKDVSKPSSDRIHFCVSISSICMS